MHVFFQNIDKYTILNGVIISLIGFLLLIISGLLRKNNIPSNYSRKFFHITFSFVWLFCILYFSFQTAIIAILLGFPFVIYILHAGKGNFFFEAISRENDYQNETFFVVFPPIFAVLGTLISKFILPNYCFIGVFNLAIADTMGEIIGLKFGYHKYNVQSLINIKAKKSVEGSLGVFIASLIVSFVSLTFFTNFDSISKIILSLFISLFVTLIEAISPDGSDNFTIPIFSTCILYILSKIFNLVC
ncbi:MAG: hypothetical protein LBR15_03450 [Methanobrevibacter sp.]|nr:hypothetical protein [Candidatus Methanovirga australis]